jgi:uncharacterized protein
MNEPFALAIFTKAPVPGFAKTRLIPLLGAEGAALLQRHLIEQAVTEAIKADIGPVALWCAPDVQHDVFQEMAQRFPITLFAQSEGDLGARMLAAFAIQPTQPLLVIGTDCVKIDALYLQQAWQALGAVHIDGVLAPAEDGGYGLIGLKHPVPQLFNAMPWSTDQVTRLTLSRAAALKLNITLLPTIWDIDEPADYERFLREKALTPLIKDGCKNLPASQ